MGLSFVLLKIHKNKKKFTKGEKYPPEMQPPFKGAAPQTRKSVFGGTLEGINSFAFLTLAHAVARSHGAPTTTSWAQIEGMAQAYPTRP